jgi:hypothetical protein
MLGPDRPKPLLCVHQGVPLPSSAVAAILVAPVVSGKLVSSRVHRWLLDPGSIDKSTAARLTDASMQQRLVARAADLGKHWPDLPVARKRAVLAALVERIEVSLYQIDIRLRPPRLGVLLDVTATSLQSMTDDESRPCRCQYGCAAPGGKSEW